MAANIDMHTHSTASDGVNSPALNIRLAAEKGMGGLAVTDHDTVSGVSEALCEADNYSNFICIPGIEISTLANGQDIHVLGYFIDHENAEFLSKLEQLRTVRNKRNEKIVKNLQKLGFSITMEEVAAKKKSSSGNIGRPHIAEVLMEKGIISSLREAFEKYLGKGKAAYAVTERISPAEAIKIIFDAGGVPVLAHPGLYDQDELIPMLKEQGLAGLEVYHSDHSAEQEAHYRHLAERYQLIPTGGSDYHGIRNGTVFHGELGNRYSDLKTVERLKSFSKKYR
ncbi:PHP domain-containing protein [Fictibacillus terranigra]|uniref:PHP domain-containing protein n=1 Tax=Fictibacillus terranigra TaxID=3058424 RepID=A0ABT8E5T6_9BACL|nr:PHP domain-containing protein [Fictibacillus sp. CENA-BCM004]MDN4073271.1 PHP domain-containing protein [Fictibacillus sp. CENA-BCM004]